MARPVLTAHHEQETASAKQRDAVYSASSLLDIPAALKIPMAPTHVGRGYDGIVLRASQQSPGHCVGASVVCSVHLPSSRQLNQCPTIHLTPSFPLPGANASAGYATGSLAQRSLLWRPACISDKMNEHAELSVSTRI